MSAIIDRANRLMGLKDHPGFADLMQISQQLVKEAVDSTSDYPGWDKDMMVVLKVRQQAAKEHHMALTQRVAAAIQAGIEEARASVANFAQQPVAEMQEQGDYVRQAVLTKFEEQDNRVPGSY
jgi:hypothetical protein